MVHSKEDEVDLLPLKDLLSLGDSARQHNVVAGSSQVCGEGCQRMSAPSADQQ
jgi:hypothetical protein